MEYKIPWKSDQERMGCYACRFADRKALGKRACCTHYQGPNGNPCTREQERQQRDAQAKVTQ